MEIYLINNKENAGLNTPAGFCVFILQRGSSSLFV